MKKFPVPGLLGSFIVFVTALFLLHTILDYNRTLAVARRSSARILDQSSHTVHAELRRICYGVQQLFSVVDGANREEAIDFLSPRTINRITIPFLRNDVSMTSFNYGNASGDGYLLLQTDKGFRNRLKFAREGGKVTWIELDGRGDETARQTLTDDYDPRIRPWYMAAIRGKGICWSGPYTFRTTRDIGITASMVLSPRVGKGTEVVGVDIKLKDFSAFLSSIAIQNGTEICVLDEEGFVLACSWKGDPEKMPAVSRGSVLSRIGSPGYALQGAIVERYRKTGLDSFDIEHDGKGYFAKVASFSMGDDKRVLTVLTLPRHSFTEEFLVSFHRNLALFVISLLVLSTYFMVRHLVPLRRIANYARGFNFDDPPPPISIRGSGEVQALAADINAMVETIRRKSTALRLSEEHYRTLVQSASSIILRCDTRGIITFINDPGARFFGYRADELKGRRIIGTILAEVDSAGRDMGRMIEGIFADPDAYASNLNENITRDGRRVWINWNNAALRDENGTIIEILSVGSDVTFQVEAEREIRTLNESLEQRVRERTAAYEASNRELESFCYSVSHDLRAPLRHIDGFTRILQEDFAGYLPMEASEILERISRSSRRMAELIDDLLNLSRVTRQEISPLTVDLSGMVREIAAELRQSEPDRQVDFSITDGVVVRGDPMLLRLAMENLLGNAWKYTARSPAARITFGVESTSDGVVYSVSDNGVGFDMAYVDKLFQPFQRLHRSDEFEGTGIGLAIVQRIISRHGGRVWARGEVGKGATFSFVLGSGGG